MNHRHLLPTEIDLLLDGEEGFGVAQLKAHVHSCIECQGRLEEARFVTDALEELSRFAPSHAFAERVMSQVPVYVPWHVAARDSVRRSVRRWGPQTRPARVAALVIASSVASVLTAAILWIATQTDLLVFATGIAGSQLRDVVAGAGRDALVSLLGPETLAVVGRAGVTGLSLLLLVFFGAAAGATFGLRAIAVASSRRRS